MITFPLVAIRCGLFDQAPDRLWAGKVEFLGGFLHIIDNKRLSGRSFLISV